MAKSVSRGNLIIKNYRALKIDSIIWSFCLRHIVKRSILFGRGNAKQKLCKIKAKQSGVRYNKQNKHQLLHRIASVQTSLIHNNLT